MPVGKGTTGTARQHVGSREGAREVVGQLRRVLTVGGLVLVLMPAMLAQTARSAEALLETAKVPISLVKPSPLTFTPAGALVTTGVVACILWCDSLIDWGAGYLGGTTDRSGTAEGASGLVGPVTWNYAAGSGWPGGLTPVSGNGPAAAGYSFAVLMPGQNDKIRVNEVVSCKRADGTQYTKPNRFVGTMLNTQTAPVAGELYGYNWTNGCTSPEVVVKLQTTLVREACGNCYHRLFWQSDDPATAPGPFTATVTCRTPGGGSAVATGTSAVATQIVPPDCETVLPGSYREKLQVQQAATGDGNSHPTPVLDIVADVATYPDCLNRASPCPLGWATPTETEPSPCKWGPYIMPDTDCEPFGPKPVYEPATAPSPGPSPSSTPIPVPPPYDPDAPDPNAPVNPDSGGGTRINPDGSTTTTQVNPDGSTTTRTDYPDGSTVTTTSAPATTNPDGTTSPGASTTVRTPPTGAGTQALPQDGGSCLSQAFGWNPIDWVYIPVKCALEWAFVPPAGSLQAAKTKADSGWTATKIPEWGGALGGIGTGLAAVGGQADGCAGPQFTLNLSRVGGGSRAFAPLDACSQPMQGVAVVIKVLLCVAITVAGARFCARPLMAAFGMGEAVK